MCNGFSWFNRLVFQLICEDYNYNIIIILYNIVFRTIGFKYNLNKKKKKRIATKIIVFFFFFNGNF